MVGVGTQRKVNLLLLLRWVFIAARGLILVAASGATLPCSAWASHGGDFSLQRTAQALGTQASTVAPRGL